MVKVRNPTSAGGVGSMAHTIQSLGEAGLGLSCPVLSCLFEGKAKEANFDVSVRSRPGDVGQWFAPDEGG
jgi:hypothetical protein